MVRRVMSVTKGESGIVRVVVADDTKELRELIVRLLQKHPLLNVVAQASDTESTLESVATHLPDVALIDLSMPGNGGLYAIAEIKIRHPECRVVVLSGLPRDQAESAALAAGAVRYLEKGVEIGEVVEAVFNAGKR